MTGKAADELSKRAIVIEALKYALGTAGALVLAAVSINPDQASANLTGWIRFLNPSVSASYDVSHWVVVVAVGAAVIVIAIALASIALSLKRDSARQLSILDRLNKLRS